MHKRLLSLFLAASAAALLITSPASALEVAVSIKPIHSLVSAVMQGVGTPSLLIGAAGSEHAYSLKPSDAQALERAEVVFYVGPGMETFLAKPLESLAADAKVIAVEDLPGLTKLAQREGGPFEHHDHAGESEEAHDADGAGHAEDHHEDELDLHVWLDPENGKAIVAGIADVLAQADPANAARYEANASAYASRLDALAGELTAELAPVKSRPFIVFHDAYQYFERRFGLDVAGSITVNPEVTPGAQRIAEIQAKVQALGATCVFSEPQFEPKLVQVVIEGSGARTGVLDPLGSSLPDGPDLYPDLLRELARSLKTCLADPA